MSALAVWATVAPTVGIGLGYVGTIFTEERRDKRAAAAASTARAAARRDALVDRREDFELSHLSEVHEQLRALAQNSLPGALGEQVERHQWQTANRQLWSLSGLILDDELRATVEAARQATRAFVEHGGGATGVFADRARFDEAMGKSVDALGAALDAVAERLRDIYQGPVNNP